MKRACAILATYNEADILLESVGKLLDGGVDVYLIDNGSTDASLALISPLVGKGVVDVQTLRFHENGQEIYNWSSILQAKEKLSKTLGYDWYLHVDADEIRYSPWPELSLREAIDKVDRSGYNLINFKLFNFRLTHDLTASEDYERDMPLYAAGELFNQYQIKAWKAHEQVDIVSYGGHIVQRPDPRLYPVRFIHKHYPIRSLEHGRRKIMNERRDRFSTAERQRGWHVQYDHIGEVSASDVFCAPDTLQHFDRAIESDILLREGLDMASQLLAGMDARQGDELVNARMQVVADELNFDGDHARQLLAIANQLIELLGKGAAPDMVVNPADGHFLRTALETLAAQRFLRGEASLFYRTGRLHLHIG